MRTEYILKHILATPLAIDPDWVSTIMSIVQRDKDLSALAAKGMKPYKFNTFKRGRTAILPIDGPIFSKASMFDDISGAVSTEQLAQAFQTAQDDKSVDQIVLKFDRAPGGEVPGGDEFAQLIRESEKPVYAHVTGQCCSLAYWYASQADEISMSPTSILGSIGVVQVIRPNKDDGKIEIVNSASPLKRQDPDAPDTIARIQDTLDKIAGTFFQDVATGRNVSVETVKYEFGQGGIKVGQDCIDAGMADRICSFEDLMSDLATGKTGPTESPQLFGEDNMDLKTLKAEHPEVYLAAVNEGSDKIRAELDAVKAEKQALEDKLKAAMAKADGLTAGYEKKIAGLEAKISAIEVEAAKATAEQIFAEKFAASKLDAKLEPKVRMCVKPGNFKTEDGSFDSEAYAQALDAELADWKQVVGSSSVQGFGADDGNQGKKVDETVDRLLGYLN